MFRVCLFKPLKRTYRQYTPEALLNAYKEVTEKGISVRKAARLFGVPEVTLRMRVTGAVDTDTVKSGPSPLFSTEQEQRLIDHVEVLTRVGFVYTRIELCNLATEYAVSLGLRQEENPLSLQWLRSFISRWPNWAVKKPRTLSMARTKATSDESVKAYYEELGKVLEKHGLQDKPKNIYYVDEKGISDNHCPSRTVADNDKRPASDTGASDTAYTVTVLGAGNATGTAIPAYFVFPGARMRKDLLDGSTAGVSGTVSKNGCSNSRIFRQYLETHFLKHAQRRDSTEPLLLLYDGYRCHLSVGIIEWAKQQNIILFVLPAHTSHILQPRDTGCVEAFQTKYDDLREKFMKEKSVSMISKHATCELACKAYNHGLLPANLRSSFKNCGVYPFDPATIKKLSFASD
ncbi:Jerky protein homolog-like [Mizuhopecten yessoensis]|uniref:Jerky protein homolog-like n=1 Tax=Mizuhopecten yessoensis TaxID=6573 RepID=A0A210Q9Y7_MIZYE|nr:Jerky protein homolog-like [Mizuhopecten yessoensis]